MRVNRFCMLRLHQHAKANETKVADNEILGSQFVILIIELVTNSQELSLLRRRQYQELIM